MGYSGIHCPRSRRFAVLPTSLEIIAMLIRRVTYLLALGAIVAVTVLPARARAQPQRQEPHQSGHPRIGSSRSVVASTWAYDPLYGAPECKSTMCNYVSGPVHLLVNFNSNSVVTDIQMYQYPDPGQSKYWHMLLGFLPAGATKQSCRRFTHTSGLSGPARACRYRWQGHTILVAQWLRENPLTRGGWVDTGMNYHWLQRF